MPTMAVVMSRTVELLTKLKKGNADRNGGPDEDRKTEGKSLSACEVWRAGGRGRRQKRRGLERNH